MADLFSTDDISSLLRNKHIIFIGDSNVRALYKDFVWLLNNNSLINNNCLRTKLEKSFMGDRLDSGSALSKSRDYVEERSYSRRNFYVKFYFVTRCYCDIIVNLMKLIREGTLRAPDVIIMNSLLWDIARWGPNGVEEFKDNMVKLMEVLKISLPPRTLFMWTTAPPIGLKSIRGGLMIKQIEFMERSLRFHIMEANVFTQNLVNSYGFDVVDSHFHLQFQISRRSSDNVHFLPLPVRLLTNLCLTHIALSWGRALPRKGDFMFVQEEIDIASGRSSNDSIAQINHNPNLSNNQQSVFFHPTFGPGSSTTRDFTQEQMSSVSSNPNFQIVKESAEAVGCVMRSQTKFSDKRTSRKPQISSNTQTQTSTQNQNFNCNPISKSAKKRAKKIRQKQLEMTRAINQIQRNHQKVVPRPLPPQRFQNRDKRRNWS